MPSSCTGAGQGKYSALAYSSLAAYIGRTVADINPIPADKYRDSSHSRSAGAEN